jgi:hypothetical protein
MAYIGNGPGVASQRIVSTLTATDGQTSFTPTSGYTVGYVDVYLNGVKLISGTDFTASNGTNVVLTSGAATGDTLEVVAYLPRGLSDGYTKAEADALIAAIDLTAFNSPVQLKNYTTTQRNALTGLESGDTIYNSTTGSIEFYDGANWISTNLIPTVDYVTGTIYAGAASNVTVAAINATDAVTVRFSEGGSILADVDSVDMSSGSASVAVPSAVYGQTAGDTISVSILNQDGTPSSNAITKTVEGLPTGGTITTYGTYRVHTFTSSGTFTVPTGFSATVDYLIVAGGGAGGSAYYSGGGGAGGMLTGTSSVSANSYSIAVGAGGAGGNSSVDSTNGSNSSALSLTSIGGGHGGSGNTAIGAQIGQNGGSGGGGTGPGNQDFAGGSGTTGQGNAGAYSSGYDGGGGGGKSAAGINNGRSGSLSQALGGAGATNSIQTGSAQYYAAGGGAHCYYAGSGSKIRASGIGGVSTIIYEQGTATTAELDGVVNTGSGGGGYDQRASGYVRAGNGSSGIVVIRYQI